MSTIGDKTTFPALPDGSALDDPPNAEPVTTLATTTSEPDPPTPTSVTICHAAPGLAVPEYEQIDAAPNCARRNRADVDADTTAQEPAVYAVEIEEVNAAVTYAWRWVRAATGRVATFNVRPTTPADIRGSPSRRG
jgi:hypothetical protein